MSVPNITMFKKMNPAHPLMVFFYLTMVVFALSHLGYGSHSVTVIQFFSAIPRGILASTNLIALVLILGGTFAVIDRTGVIRAAIGSIWHQSNGKINQVAIITTVFISSLSAFFGVLSELILLIPIMIKFADEINLPRIIAVALVIISAKIGFAVGVMNPFTVQIPQALAGLPLNSGFLFRLCCYITTLIITCYFINRKINHLSYPVDSTKPDHFITTFSSLGREHYRIIFTIVFIYAAMSSLIWLLDLPTKFITITYLLIAITVMLVARLPLYETAYIFAQGIKKVTMAALIVGFARGVEIMLKDAGMVQQFIEQTASHVAGLPKFAAIISMLFLQMGLDVFLPSATAQATTSMPILLPIASQLNIHPQLVVLAFQYGDGFTNLITPTSGILLAFLAVGNIKYIDWCRFILPFFVITIPLSICFLYVAMLIFS